MTRIGDHDEDTGPVTDPWSGRHLSVQHFQPLFGYQHLPDRLQLVSQPFADLAVVLLGLLGDGAELSACLRKLLEAKDCAVRQAVLDDPRWGTGAAG